MPRYFAYGSNMDEAAMRARCSRARVLGLARLPRHRFALMANGYATVRPDADAHVHGVLYDLAPSDVAPLDRYEDVSGGLYVKAWIPVVPDGAPVRRALVYRGTEGDGEVVAEAGYMEAIASAARAFALPPAYVAALQAMVPCADVSGRAR